MQPLPKAQLYTTVYEMTCTTKNVAVKLVPRAQNV